MPWQVGSNCPRIWRPWLRPWHLVCLADNSTIAGDFNLVGGNMAFARRVLDKVPAFDVELGPGAMGFCDDTLLFTSTSQRGLSPYRRSSTSDRRASLRRASVDTNALMMCSSGRDELPTWIIIGRIAPFGSRVSVVGSRYWPWPDCRCCGNFSANAIVIQPPSADWRWSYYRQLAAEFERPRRTQRFGLEKMVISFPMEKVCDERKRRAA